MNEALAKSLQHLTGSAKLEDVSESILSTIATEYPYFSLAQLLLTLKYKQNNHPLYTNQFKKTTLYFDNPKWVELQTMSIDASNPLFKWKHSTQQVEEKSVHTNEQIEVNAATQTSSDIDSSSEVKHFKHIEIPSLESVKGMLSSEQQTAKEDFTVKPSVVEESQPVVVAEEKPNEVDELVNKYLNKSKAESVEHVVIPPLFAPFVETPSENSSKQDVFEIPRPLFSDEDLKVSREHRVKATANPTINTTPPPVVENIQPDVIQPVTPAITIPPTPFKQVEEDVADDTEAEEQEAAHENLIPDRISNLLGEFKKDFVTSTPETVSEIKLDKEPYYTVDYFDSQGIKVNLNEPTDKLGKKLLKFTDWLKYIQKNNPNPLDLGTSPEVEQKISKLAEFSNERREIVTETMAEVYVSQGKLDKAIQTYIKLSFLYPDKTLLFAKKIQEIKGI